jgi:hypothetical protein
VSGLTAVERRRMAVERLRYAGRTEEDGQRAARAGNRTVAHTYYRIGHEHRDQAAHLMAGCVGACCGHLVRPEREDCRIPNYRVLCWLCDRYGPPASEPCDVCGACSAGGPSYFRRGQIRLPDITTERSDA